MYAKGYAKGYAKVYAEGISRGMTRADRILMTLTYSVAGEVRLRSRAGQGLCAAISAVVPLHDANASPMPYMCSVGCVSKVSEGGTCLRTPIAHKLAFCRRAL